VVGLSKVTINGIVGDSPSTSYRFLFVEEFFMVSGHGYFVNYSFAGRLVGYFRP
jgi:hypothetical protein